MKANSTTRFSLAGLPIARLLLYNSLFAKTDLESAMGARARGSPLGLLWLAFGLARDDSGAGVDRRAAVGKSDEGVKGRVPTTTGIRRGKDLLDHRRVYGIQPRHG
jgi:hypothetical protein